MVKRHDSDESDSESEDILPNVPNKYTLNDLVGLTIDKARKMLKHNDIKGNHGGKAVRITALRQKVVDGETLQKNVEPKPERVNVETRNGKITKIINCG